MNYEDKRKLIAEDWHNFFVLGKNKTRQVNKEVRDSWERSRKNKINYEKIDIEKNDYDYQKISKEKNSVFIDTSRPYMDNLYNIINNSDFMITLLDKDGFVLDSVLNKKVVDHAGFRLINLSEERVGTNAMGTSLYLDKPFQSYGAEHCYKLLHKFTTAAAPIHDNSGNLIGCIGITGFSKDVSVHTLGMAIAASYAIENKMKLYEGKNPNNNINKNNLYSFEDIIGGSDSIKETINIAKVASRGNSNVLIMGESGTGKELFAQSIHSNSPRKNKPFIDINCAALPLSLAESELFGYEGGSYTGARKEGQPGKFELADGGTIFLDEIGELPLSIQAALLRVIQERKITRIGATTSRDIDVMIVAATNRDLFKSVEENTFRGDLFYRLNVFNINIPPLRENKEDIPELVYNFIGKYNKLFNLNIEGIEEEALNILRDYDWPGNIRQLENMIERSIQLAENKKIRVKDLPSYLKTHFNKINLKDTRGRLESQEKKEIVNVLKKTMGNIKQTSEILGIGRATVYRKIERYNIDIEEYRTEV